MKIYLRFISGLLLCLSHVLVVTTGMEATHKSSTHDLSLFDQANNHYRNRAYEKAFELYEKIDNKEAHTYYNMGNCAYQLEKKGLALLYWRKAEKVWGLFNRKELLENITLLKQKLSPTLNHPPREVTVFDTTTNYLISTLRTIPLFILQMLFLLLWIFLFAYLKYLYKKKHTFLISLLFTCIAILSISLVIRYRFDLERYGIVLHNNTPLRSGPETSFKAIDSLNEGTEVTILKQSKSSFKVRVNNEIGWISADNIGKV